MKSASLTSDLITRPCAKPLDRSAPRTMHQRANSRRRGLVLTDESASHLFRASLPPHVKRDLHEIPAERLWALTREDIQGAASVYFAATAGILAFIV
ncbi:MAG: hypothetical protein V2I27_02760 [Erythrobacter sp.]|jgi:hypothetical protein|nr:hypothetical protein [Erythrobacter sp.]